jgi:flavodoxin short chain
VFGSTTGNTSWVADKVTEQLKAAGHSVSTKNVAGVSAKELCSGHDLTIFGCSTWGQDDIELQDDFVPFFENFDQIGAKGAKTAVYGCGDIDYPHFCGAVDLITEKLKELGSEIIVDKLKINGDPSSAEDDIKNWNNSIISVLGTN